MTRQPLLRSLGYLDLEVTDLDAWEHFATKVLGAEATRADDGTLWIRLDDFPYRFTLHAGSTDSLIAVGWEVADRGTLDQLESHLYAHGVESHRGSRSECECRRVMDMLVFTDPAGITVEAFCGIALNHRPPANPYATEFVTGDQGLGHLVLGVADDAALRDFYTDVLGFGLRDAIAVPAAHLGRPADEEPSWVQFLGCNPRHHSLAFFPTTTPTGIIHVMIEVATIDQVGRALDRAHKRQIPMSSTLGRHVNDEMYGFYMKTPSGFDLEYGADGLRVDDPDAWITRQSTALSYWGHDFTVGAGHGARASDS